MKFLISFCFQTYGINTHALITFIAWRNKNNMEFSNTTVMFQMPIYPQNIIPYIYMPIHKINCSLIAYTEKI